MSTNADRADRAAIALVEYDLRYLDGDCHKDNDFSMAAGDFVSDLMHFCDHAGIDFEGVLANARMHHDAEVEEERECDDNPPEEHDGCSLEPLYHEAR